MSEFINNGALRQEKLKNIIKKLHAGVSIEMVRAEFEELTESISAIEITAMEQALVDEGMPVEEIQKLCDVHASVFKGSIKDIHAEDGKGMAMLSQWHPLNKLKMENRKIETMLEQSIVPFLDKYEGTGSDYYKDRLQAALTELLILDKHYSKKEHLIFPYMEKHDITAPPQVMWGVDDEIRGKIKTLIIQLGQEVIELKEVKQLGDELVNQVQEMIFKEEEIMMPMVLEKFAYAEWVDIEAGCFDIGFVLLDGVEAWQPTEEEKLLYLTSAAGLSSDKSVVQLNERIPFDAGSLLPEEINAILNTLPLDMTFVGADERVKYFTQGKERIFDRPKTIIGREVKNCHPPKSVHVVEQIVADLRSGKKDHEDFWIKMGGKFVYIRYFAVRNAAGEFLGTLEMTQDIKPIQELEGEKRLMSESE